jgi:thiamine-monophosphate kinase
VPSGKALRRSGASPGDRIFLTGALGGSAAQLASLSSGGERTRRTRRISAPTEHPHLFPEPRLAAGQALVRRRLATACIDVSDGLSTDLAHLCEASGVAAEIDPAKLPLHPLARSLAPQAALEAALHGGEDYELLFTASAEAAVPRAVGGVPATCIGQIVRTGRGRPTVSLLEPGGARTPLTPRGWEHLR